MANYRRMGSVEEHLGGNATLIASLHYQLSDLWRSPRGTVLRIEALALVAIILSFFLAFFGSCRRWSNRWIVQKGFLAAQVLSLSLGTYSIGLMQSSPVKSEMYPIWAVSLLTLFGCVDPVSTYIDLDYKGPLSKMIFQLCLYYGYVMLMSVSTISSGVGKLAVVLLSTITFIKGFHRALAFVLPGQIRAEIASGWLQATEPAALAGHVEDMIVDWTHSFAYAFVSMTDIKELRLPEGATTNGMMMKDVCLSHSFSNLLRQRFLGLDTARKMEEKFEALERLVQDGQLTTTEYKRALKVVEVELAFLFEAFFTSNEFLHFYQAKTGSFWALFSFFGICFVGLVAAIIPGAMASQHSVVNSTTATGVPGAGTSVAVNIVGTTVADLIITLVILVSLALLQLVQLIRCWTSNWARVIIACEYAIRNSNTIISMWVMRLRLFVVARVTWFDKYLWQARLGQDSLAALVQRNRAQLRWRSVLEMACCPWRCERWLTRVGVRYFCQVVGALLLSDTTNTGGVVKLHDDLKTSIAEFLGTIKSRRIGVEWSALFVKNGLQDWLEYLPYANISGEKYLAYANTSGDESEAHAFTRCVMIWHIATWYCEEAEKVAGGNRGGGGEDSSREKNRRVAMDLSKYFAYLVVSAPELLPGPAAETKQALNTALCATDEVLKELAKKSSTITMLEAMQQASLSTIGSAGLEFVRGSYLGKRLRNDEMKTPPILEETEMGGMWREVEQSTRRPCSTDHWELLALVWVQTFLYAAPYGDVQAHMQHLAQGGEFITHLWALLYHLGIDKWEVAGIDELKGGAAAAETTREEDAGSGSEIEEIN